MEIEQQTDGDVHQLEVAEELGLMDWQDFFDSFYFDEETSVDEQIEAKRVFADMMFVSNIHCLLIGDLEASIRKLTGKAPFVNGFQKTGTLVLMDFQCGCNHLPAQSVCLFEKRVHF